MLFSLLISISFLTQLLLAVDLNIYKSVTEIRQILTGTGTYENLFKNGEYENIIDGSISWDGTPFLRQEIYNTMETLKGALVTVRQATVCECNVIQAKIVDPNAMLLENVDTGVYFYADSRTVEYTSKRPDNGGTTLRIEFKNKKTKYDGTLSYLVRGITWAPNYDLFITDTNTCNLQGYAVIRNNQQQEYEIDNTYLYSGDLQLVNTYSSPVLFQAVAKSAMQSNASPPLIQNSGEEKGFYFYSLKTKYTLRPSSSIRLPFITSTPQCQFYYKTTAGIGTGQYKGVFQRNYDLTFDRFLPSGILTVRDNQILIGQSYLPDVPDNYTQTITLGQDNDVRYVIKGNLTASSEDKAKITWRTYALDVKISNYKNKDVKGQLAFYGAIKTTIESTTCDTAKVDGSMINLPFEIKQNGNYQCQLTVTLQWG